MPDKAVWNMFQVKMNSVSTHRKVATLRARLERDPDRELMVELTAKELEDLIKSLTWALGVLTDPSRQGPR